ncbi:MAG: hypothetical protein R2795_23185 [Saprospiraceae bacterium]
MRRRNRYGYQQFTTLPDVSVSILTPQLRGCIADEVTARLAIGAGFGENQSWKWLLLGRNVRF